jgi:hypothetical protein
MTISTEAALAKMKAAEAVMFATQDVWEDTGCAVGTEQHKAYKVAFNAFRAARSAWINA